MRRHLLLLAWLLPLVLGAQSPPARKARPALLPTGLKILSTTLEPDTNHGRMVVIKVQNVTDKTVVGYVLLFQLLDKDGLPLGDPAGTGNDWAGPENRPDNAAHFILPGQIATIQGLGLGDDAVDAEAVTAEARVAGVVYEDRSWEGKAAGMLFSTRQKEGREARQAATKEPPGERKTDLERRAAWFEAHGPKGAGQ